LLSTTFRRRLVQATVAGALVAIPLATIAGTASAQTPDPSDGTIVVPEGADISGRPHHGHPGNPWVEFRGEDNHQHPGDGPRIFHGFRLPTGSGG
jgi:hypothetical protein